MVTWAKNIKTLDAKKYNFFLIVKIKNTPLSDLTFLFIQYSYPD